MNDDRIPTVVRPGEGPMFDAAGDRYRFLSRSPETAGRYALWEALITPGGGPPPHRHRNEDEAFYVLDGVVTFHTDEGRITAGPGTFVKAPSGAMHWFRNDTKADARMLILIAPGGMEAMFEATGTNVTDASAPITAFGPEERERIINAAPRFGIELLVD